MFSRDRMTESNIREGEILQFPLVWFYIPRGEDKRENAIILYGNVELAVSKC